MSNKTRLFLIYKAFILYKSYIPMRFLDNDGKILISVDKFLTVDCFLWFRTTHNVQIKILMPLKTYKNQINLRAIMR